MSPTTHLTAQQLEEIIINEVRQGTNIATALANHANDFRHLPFNELVELAQLGMRHKIHWETTIRRATRPSEAQINTERVRLAAQANELRGLRTREMQRLSREHNLQYSETSLPGDLGTMTDAEYAALRDEFVRVGRIRASSNRRRRRVTGALDNLAARISLWLGTPYQGANGEMKPHDQFTVEDAEAVVHRLSPLRDGLSNTITYFELLQQLLRREGVATVRDLSHEAKTELLRTAEHLKLRRAAAAEPNTTEEEDAA